MCPCRCQALLYGDAEKPVETGAKAAPGAAEPRPACTCDKKPCGCQKAEVNYAFLHSTGNGAPGPHCSSKTHQKKKKPNSGSVGKLPPPAVRGGRGTRRCAAAPRSSRARSPDPRRRLPGTPRRGAFLRPAKKTQPKRQTTTTKTTKKSQGKTTQKTKQKTNE